MDSSKLVTQESHNLPVVELSAQFESMNLSPEQKFKQADVGSSIRSTATDTMVKYKNSPETTADAVVATNHNSGDKIATNDNITGDTSTVVPEISSRKQRRVTGLKLKANVAPPSSDGLRRFALRTSNSFTTPDLELGIVSKELPKLFVSDHIHEWRDFVLERTPYAMLELEHEATPFQSMDHFLTAIYSAIASGPDGPICEDRYLIWSNVTRTTMATLISPARSDGTIPKAARFTHFVPSNLLIVKIPVDCHSPAGFLDFVTKSVVGWAAGLGLARLLKLCGNTRYVAKIRDSAVEGVDGFGSFNEADMGFRPFRVRPHKFDTPSVVVESSYGGDYGVLRYKACWWLQLMCGEVRAVVLVNVDPSEQLVTLEVWRNEVDETGPTGGMEAAGGGGPVEVPTRVQKIVISKKEEFRGATEEANAEHYRVEGGALWMRFEDFFLEAWPCEQCGDVEGMSPCTGDLCIDEETLAQEAADLWFGDGELVNDWYESVLSKA